MYRFPRTHYGIVITDEGIDEVSTSLAEIMNDLGKTDGNGVDIQSATITSRGPEGHYQIKVLDIEGKLISEYLIRPEDRASAS